MSDQGNWGPPPGAAPPPPEDDDDYEPRDSAEDLTVPWTPSLEKRIEQQEAAARAAAGHGAPPAGPTAAGTAPAEEKKSKKGLLIGGCAGCLFIVLSICCCSGYLLYLEEGVSYSDPGDELQSFPIAQGEPIDVTVTFDGTGYASLRAYVDVGEDAPSTTRVTGVFDCSEYGLPEPASVDEQNLQYGDVPEGWIHLPRVWEYVREGGSMHCQGRLTSDPPTEMRLVITKRQRPSDWVGGL